MDSGISAAMVARSRVVAEPRWSPDGDRLAWLESFDGRSDLRVAPAGGGASALVTSDIAVGSAAARGGAGFAWAGSGELVVAADDGRLVVLGASGGPPRRVLSDGGRALGPVVSNRGVVAFSRELDDACDVCVVPLDGSALPRAVSHADYGWDPAWSPDGSLLAWHEWDLPNMPWDGSRITVAHLDSALAGLQVEVIAGGDREAVGQPRFAPDGSAVAFTSDRTGFVNVWLADAYGAHHRPLLSEPNEHAEPSWSPGQRSYAWSPDSKAIALCRNEAGFGRLVRVPLEQTGRGGAVEVGKAWHRGLDWCTSGIAAIRSGARTPESVVAYVTGGARATIARGPAGGFEAAGLVEPEEVHWQSGGVWIHGLLSEPGTPSPRGVPPLLVDVHGGPTGQALAEWRARVAYWASRGWAVLRPNPRGSTGYGRAFVEALAGCWGECDVADIAAGIRHVTGLGRADASRVAIAGSSSGGMAAMLVCLRHPDLVRAGVSVSGVADLLALVEGTHRFESRYVDRLVGALPASASAYRERSVVTHARELSVPLLVLQGADDDVVPVSQAEALVAGARSGGVDVAYKVYEAEGHTLRRLDSVIDELERTDAFLTHRVLGR